MAAVSAASPSLVVLGEQGDNPLAYWEEITWEVTDPRRVDVSDQGSFRIRMRDDDNDNEDLGIPRASGSMDSTTVDTEAATTIKEGRETDAAFEAEILRNPFSVTLWTLYLDSRKAMSTRGRFTIYERAVKVLPRSYKLWFRYLQERLAALADVPPSSSVYAVTNNAFERCLVHLSQMPRLWIMYIEFLQRQPFVTRTRRCFDRALQSLPITQHYRMWTIYIPWVDRVNVAVMAVAVYRRYLMLEPSKVAGYIELLKRLGRYDEAAVTLARTLDDNAVQVEGKTPHQLWVDLCELISHHPKEIVSLDVESVLKSGLRRFTDQVGRLWCLLADYFILSDQMDKARDIYEEALATVSTTHDFGIVFDTYAKFLESLVSSLMRNETSESILVDLLLARLEDLLARRPLLLSSVKLRQNPHNVVEWLNRIRLLSDDPIKVVHTFTEALLTIDPNQSVGRLTYLWIKFSQYYEVHGDLMNTRAVFERATKAKFKNVEDLAGIWSAWVEMELRHRNYREALDVSRRSICKPARPAGAAKDNKEELQQRNLQQMASRSVRLWSLCADMEKNFGTLATLKTCYEKMFDLKCITPSQVLTYTSFLESNKYWEEAFRVYEKGVAIFRWPHVYDVWMTYLAKFIARYGGRKLERARELFEQALSDCPYALAKYLYLMYGKLEEEYGLARHAIRIYERGTTALEEPSELYQFYCLLVAKTAEFFGVTRSRQIFEAGIERLAASDQSAFLAVKLSERYADIERGVGETDRARGILQHASQFCDPRKCIEFWQKWREFEVAHGNEDTFRDMLRAKRSVQALYTKESVRELHETVKARMAQGSTVQPGGQELSAMAQLEAQAEMRVQ